MNNKARSGDGSKVMNFRFQISSKNEEGLSFHMKRETWNLKLSGFAENAAGGLFQHPANLLPESRCQRSRRGQFLLPP